MFRVCFSRHTCIQEKKKDTLFFGSHCRKAKQRALLGFKWLYRGCSEPMRRGHFEALLEKH